MKKFLKLFTLTLGMAFMLFTSCSNGSDSTDELLNDDGYITLISSKNIDFTGSPNSLISAEELSKIENINTLLLEVSNYSSTDDNAWWANIYTDESWTNEIKGTWSDDIKGYTCTISEDKLSEYLSNGLYLAGGNGATAEVAVKYTVKE